MVPGASRAATWSVSRAATVASSRGVSQVVSDAVIRRQQPPYRFLAARSAARQSLAKDHFSFWMSVKLAGDGVEGAATRRRSEHLQKEKLFVKNFARYARLCRGCSRLRIKIRKCGHQKQRAS